MTNRTFLDPRPSLRDGTPTIRFRGRGQRRVHGVGLMRGGAVAKGPRGLIGVLLVVMALGAVLGAAVRGAAPLSAAERAAIAAEYAVEEQQAAQSAEVEPAPAEATPVGELARTFAQFDGLEIGLPSPNVLLIGFHEASSRVALEMEPAGRLLDNANRSKVAAPPDVDDGPGYIVLSSRGRSAAGTSAVDIVLRDGEPVMSPVTGTVVDVGAYSLYGRYPDHRIVIEPDGHPDLRVTLIHVDGVSVGVGNRVVAGETELSPGPNRFGFTSHIDRYFPQDRWPHVHLEVKRV